MRTLVDTVHSIEVLAAFADSFLSRLMTFMKLVSFLLCFSPSWFYEYLIEKDRFFAGYE